MIDNLKLLLVSLDVTPHGPVHRSAIRLIKSIRKTGIKNKIDIIHNSIIGLCHNDESVNEYAIEVNKIDPHLQTAYGRNMRVKCLSEYTPESAGFTMLLDVDMVCLNPIPKFSWSESSIYCSQLQDETAQNMCMPSCVIIPNSRVNILFQTWWKATIIHDDAGAFRPDIKAWNAILTQDYDLHVQNLPKNLLSCSSTQIHNLLKSTFLHYGSELILKPDRLVHDMRWHEKDRLLSALYLSKFYPSLCHELEKAHIYS